MPIFFHDTALFHDAAGWGILLDEHYFEHLQFCRLGLAASPTRFIADYNLALWDDEKAHVTAWLDVHSSIHNQLREWTGVSGTDLSNVDLTVESSYYQWLDSHRTEHASIRSFLGLT